MEIHGGGKMRWRRQFKGRKMDTRQCIGIVLRGIR